MDERKAAMARELLASELLNEILDGIERRAVDTAIMAKPEEHEKRADYALQARAIRSLRSELAALARVDERKPKSIA